MNENDWVDPSEVDRDKRKYGNKLCQLVKSVTHLYEKYQADKDVRNLAYYRGEFWVGDGHTRMKTSKYKAAQNEVFPILDTMCSAMAMDLPQVEMLKQTIASTDELRNRDQSISGKRVAACLNNMAEEDDLEETVFEWVLHALLFPKAVVKTTWSAEHGRVIWENKLPWEVFIDPNAKRMRDAAWAFEYIGLHWDEWKRRLKAGVYNLQEGTKPIRPDSFPSALADKGKPDVEEYQANLRKAGLKEYVSIVEFWDFRKGVVHHLHPGTGQILMTTKAPYRQPFQVLVFHPGVGRIDGIPDTGLMAPVQRDINELVNARKVMVHRLPRRMLLDESLFPDEGDFDRFKNAKTWEPVLIKQGTMSDLQKKIFITPEMQTTYDFNQHLGDNKDAIRRIAGEADYQRGVQKNIRTAAEFDGIRAGVEGRMQTRVNKLTKGVTRLFRMGLSCLQWAVRNQEYANLDMEGLVFATQDDVTSQVLAMDILTQAPRFRLLPFSPLMEDRVARRQNLINLVQTVLTQLPAEEKIIDHRELAMQLVEDFNLNPSIVKPVAQAQEELAAEKETMEAAGAGVPPGAANAPGPAAGPMVSSGMPLPFGPPV